MTRASDARGTGKNADPTDGPRSEQARPDQARSGRHDAGNGRAGAGRNDGWENGRSDRVDLGRSASARGDGGRPAPGRDSVGRDSVGRDSGRLDFGRGDGGGAPSGRTGTDRPDSADLRWPVVNRAGTARSGAAAPDTTSSDGSAYPDTKWERKARAAEAARAAEDARSAEPVRSSVGSLDSSRSASAAFDPAADGARTGSDRSAPGAAGKPAGEASRAGAQPVRSASIGGSGFGGSTEGARGGRDSASPGRDSTPSGSGRGASDLPASRGTTRPATPTAGAVSPSAPPPGRAPLPGPPPGMRLPGPPMPPGPRYAAAPRRRLLSGGQRGKLVMLAAALTVIGALLGFVVAAILPSTYAARTTIQYNIAGENTGDFLKTDRNLTTQVVLLTSRSVLQPVADANGVNVDDLTKQVSASILSSSDIVQLQVKNSSPDTAVQLANGIAKQYLTVANSGGGRGYLQSQLAGVRKQQSSSSSFSSTAADNAALATRAAALQAQLDQMNLTQNMSSVLTPAYALTDPVSPNRSLAGLAGGVSGLVIALMTAVTLARRWTRP